MTSATRNHITVDPDTGLISDAREVASPNCDDRPQECVPELIIVHGISLPPGQFGGPFIDQLFTNCLRSHDHEYFVQVADRKVSSHLLIRRDGELVQYVPIHRRAWHAGESCYNNRNACNDFSVGIELEGTDNSNYEEAQYLKLAEVVSALLRTYRSLSPDRIVGHADVAPGRKTDPGPQFDWSHFRRLLKQIA